MTQAGHDIAFVVRCGYPNASDALVEHILWGRTPFPFTKLSLKDVYKDAYSLYRAEKKGIVLCEFCHRIATINGLCQGCDKGLNPDPIEK